MNKKTLAIVLIMVLCAMSVLTACGKGGSGGGGGTVTPPQPELTYSDVKGTSTSSTYQNDYFGIAFTVPSSSWYVANEQDLGELVGIAASSVNDESLAAAFEESGVAFDFYAMEITTGSSTNVVLQNVGKLYGSILTADAIVATSLGTFEETLAQQGATDITVTASDCTFLGEKVNCISAVCKISGMDMYQKQVYIVTGNFVAAITVATLLTDGTDSLLALYQVK